MKIYIADPIESRINENHWQASTHKGWVIIRAENEGNAIRIASSEYGIATHKIIGEDSTPLNPWRVGLVNYTELTNEEIESSNYSLEGKEEIIAKKG